MGTLKPRGVHFQSGWVNNIPVVSRHYSQEWVNDVEWLKSHFCFLCLPSSADAFWLQSIDWKLLLWTGNVPYLRGLFTNLCSAGLLMAWKKHIMHIDGIEIGSLLKKFIYVFMIFVHEFLYIIRWSCEVQHFIQSIIIFGALRLLNKWRKWTIITIIAACRK